MNTLQLPYSQNSNPNISPITSNPQLVQPNTPFKVSQTPIRINRVNSNQSNQGVVYPKIRHVNSFTSIDNQNFVNKNSLNMNLELINKMNRSFDSADEARNINYMNNINNISTNQNNNNIIINNNLD